MDLIEQGEKTSIRLDGLMALWLWHWHKKFDDLIERLAKQSEMTYQKAMSVWQKINLSEI